MNIDDKTIQALAANLKYRQLRQELIASNIANAETPGYKARDVDFANELKNILNTKSASKDIEKTNPLHMDLSPSSQSRIVFDEAMPVAADGNNVDLDMTMGKIADNSRAYSNAANWLGVQLRMIKNAARGRVA